MLNKIKLDYAALPIGILYDVSLPLINFEFFLSVFFENIHAKLNYRVLFLEFHCINRHTLPFMILIKTIQFTEYHVKEHSLFGFSYLRSLFTMIVYTTLILPISSKEKKYWFYAIFIFLFFWIFKYLPITCPKSFWCLKIPICPCQKLLLGS